MSLMNCFSLKNYLYSILIGIRVFFLSNNSFFPNLSHSFTIYFISEVKVTQLCQTLWDPIDYTVHGILQARKLEWVAIHFSRIFPTQRSNPGLPHFRQIVYKLSHQGSPRILAWIAYSFSSRSSRPRKQMNQDLLHCRQILYQLSYQEALNKP